MEDYFPWKKILWICFWFPWGYKESPCWRVLGISIQSFWDFLLALKILSLLPWNLPKPNFGLGFMVSLGEYWRPEVIFYIARGVGTLLTLDHYTMNKSRWFFSWYWHIIKFSKSNFGGKVWFCFHCRYWNEKLPPFFSSYK